MKISSSPRVIIRHCDSYDPARIKTLVSEALDDLDLRPSGRTLLKPNLVAAGPQFPHAHTRPEVVEGVLMALQDRDDGAVQELAVGERCGITIPTRYAFAESGMDAMLARHRQVKRYCFEETTQVEVRYEHDKRLRDYVFTPEPVARADFFVNLPKFKAHPWTTVTFSLKNYIGIQDDRHRLIDHDHRLDEKIADLQHIIQPQFICIDGITAGQGRMLTPIPFDLHLLVMGNSQVAIDAVCCRILGIEPRSVNHVRLAEDYGFGTTDPEAITITGDVSLDEARKRTEGYEVGLVRVEKYFEGSHITAYAGPPPEPERTDYCWGGCPGAIEEAIEILREFDERCDEKMARLHVVFGAYDGPIDARPGEKTIFIGDCARWSGELDGQAVRIKSLYRDRGTKDPHCAKHADIYAKLAGFAGKTIASLRQPFMRLEGCPVSVAEQVMALSTLGGVKNPVFDPKEGVLFNKAYLAWRANGLARLVKRRPYQRSGPCSRGQAQPEL